MANKTPVTFVPAISQEVPWHTRQHLQLLYQKLANHTLAFANLAKTSTTENITNINNSSSGGTPAPPTPFPFPGLGSVNDQTGNTSYTTAVTDNGALLILNDASPVAVALNSALTSPYFLFATNFGVGLVTFTPTSGLINGAATYTLAQGFFVDIVFDGTNWKASAIPGGSSFSDEEIPIGLINGTNVTYTLAHSPSPAASLELFLAGLMQWQNVSGDYTLSTNTITFNIAPTLGPLLAWYRF